MTPLRSGYRRARGLENDRANCIVNPTAAMNSGVLRAFVISFFHQIGGIEQARSGVDRDPVSEGVRGKRTALWGGRIQAGLDHQDFGSICDLRHRPM